MSDHNQIQWRFIHEKIETSNFLMIGFDPVGRCCSVAWWKSCPCFSKNPPPSRCPGLKPYTALQVAGRDMYVREGCYNCHSQMIRPFRAETLALRPLLRGG
jgi:cytochrome c oxidase cbb3-type subunit 2